jgi:peroxiredoxin
MRAGVAILLLAASGWAQEEAKEAPKEAPLPAADSFTTVQPLLDRILEPLEAHASRRPAPEEKGFKEWVEEYEYLREKAVKRVLQTIAFHGPGGEGKPLDIAPACAALLGPLLAPPDAKETSALAERLLRADPKNPACWNYMRALYDRARAEAGRGERPWEPLRAWATGIRATIDGEAALALELLLGYVCHELGDASKAREAANVVVTAAAGSEDLRRDARRLRSLSSLLPPGREAPAFRLPALDGKGEITLDDFRGRAVLLHFWYVAEETGKYGSILYDCFEEISRSEVVLVSVPVFDGSDPPKEITSTFAWPVAAASLAGQDVGRAYGVEGISALFLVSPDGKVLKSDRWGLGGAVEEVRKLCADAAGPPLDTRLSAVRTWPLCRELWHDLAARRHTRYAEETWAVAKRIGPEAHAALLLASAFDREPGDREGDPGTVHGDLVIAWRAMRTGGDRAAWDRATKPLAKPSSDECLAVVDAIFDLGLYGDEVRLTLEKAARDSPRWETVSMALRAIHFCDTEASPQPLLEHMKEKSWQVRLALAEALRAYRHKQAVDALIKLLGDARMRVREKALDHLELLTGESLGVSQKAWAKWRAAQGTELRLRPREISIYRPFRPSDRKYAHKEYYGLQIASDRVVFLLDKSDSMYHGLFDGVVEEMRAHLDSAGPTSKFNVIEFAEKPVPWNAALVPANAANVEDAVKFLHREKPYGATDMIAALRMGLQTPDVDAIVILSDGLPNRGDIKTAEGILAAVGKVNRYQRVSVHTVLLLDGRHFPNGAPRGKDVPPPDEAELRRRDEMRAYAPSMEEGIFFRSLALGNDGKFSVGFADSWDPPPGAKTRPSSDE